ncbi:MAG: carbon monoxide dehydrogenase subunit G [Burkholderiales bacterium]|nr:carbon monoxide dehydrogenase subunit G [Burkholderiales bacterium]
MEMTNSRVIPASAETVWSALNDPEMLKASIPGCESFESLGDGRWRAVVATRIGPVSARFTGTMTMSDIVVPTGYTLKFEGQGGAAGFANGEAKVTLAPADASSTTLSYVVAATVGGKIAQIGSRLIDAAAAKIADDFFARFSARLAPPAEVVEGGGAIAETGEVVEVGSGRAPGSSPWIRWVSLAIIAAIIAWLAVRGLR